MLLITYERFTQVPWWLCGASPYIYHHQGNSHYETMLVSVFVPTPVCKSVLTDGFLLTHFTDWLEFFLCRLLWSEGRKTTLSQWGNGHQIKSPHPKKDLHRWWAAWNYVRSPNYYEWWRCKLHYKCSKANKVREMSIKHSLYTHIHSREDVSLSAISENTPVGIPLMCVGLTSP